MFSVDVATIGGRLFVGCFREEGQDTGPADDCAEILCVLRALKCSISVWEGAKCVVSAMWRRWI